MTQRSEDLELSISSVTRLHNETGEWRSVRPETDHKRCNSCMLCWLYCPEVCVSATEKPQIDLRYCKGCGICAEECPVGAIQMVPERK
ncbi:MAG: pyruvate synthase [Armatimonadetes bacterium CG_4_10_14_3_um_filter_59_10]|nr:MAG: pyruvate synthase [Armatimonadetes bacterium CG_4_10_14_3_um_filter_59_10]